jgi:hypothetical protein
VWIVLAVGAMATGCLAVVSARLAASNEHHLLTLRSKEVASALTSALPDIQTPLGAAVALANTTNGNAAKFERFAAPYAGSGAGRTFLSISVWRIGDLRAGPVAVAGAQPELPSVAGGANAFLTDAAAGPGLSVHGILNRAHPRLGYAYAGSEEGRFVVYAEQHLAPSRFTRLPANSAYSNLDVAVYLGRTTSPSDLILKTVRALPLPGGHAKALVPFGNQILAVVVSARQPLGGTLPARLPWAIAILGALLTLGAVVLTGRLILGRQRAQQLAEDNSRLYAEQRGIAESLQHALLPDVLPQIEGLQVAARYDAGVPGIEIGGDWYDLIPLRRERLLLVVGDVSGRGLRAATAMASLRFAIHYAAQSEGPEAFLPKLSNSPALRANGQLATVVCVMIDVQTRRLTVLSAGHPPPLMVCDGSGEFLKTLVGPPIGVDPNATYAATTFTAPAGATLLAFTDGLVERRHETLDVGLERLRKLAITADGTLEEMMATIVRQAAGPQAVDDLAIAGIRWTS